ncbi:MAG: AMP-binding protein [Gemmatimonadales bacterium]|nr:AMP-binding protein [Gemmatimonadales bacterium]
MNINGKIIPWSTLGELLVDKAQRHGDALFAEVAGTPITYRELERRSRVVGANLLARGCTRGDRIASFMSNAPEQLDIWFGCVRAGLVWVPLNAGLVGEDLAYTLRNSGSRILIADAEGAAKFVDVREELHPIELLVTDAADSDTSTAFATLLEDRAGLPELPATSPADPGAVLYTGGTTGLPKGVVLPQFSFILAGVRYGESFDVRAGEIHFSTMPLFHAGALQWGIMGPLVNDMRTVVERRFSASTYFQRVRETRANVIDAFGVVLTMLCGQPPGPADRDHCVRISVGAVHGLPPEIPSEFTRRFGIRLLLLYGLTEGGGAMLTSNREFDSDANGKPHGWVEIRIADEQGFPVETGRVGEVLLRPCFPNMFMSGYFGDPGKTVESLRDCWLHTGDMGRLDAQGDFRFTGRMSHWLRRRGESISAVEVETILAKCPGVLEAAVVAVPSELGEDEVKAFIVRDGETQVEAADIFGWCTKKMAAFKIPRFIEFIDALPRSTAKLEIDRGALRRLPNDRAFDRQQESPDRPAPGKARA